MQWKLSANGIRNMKEMHAHLRYRYVVTEFSYPDRLRQGTRFTVSFKVKNVGAAPTYCSWPVALVLLDPRTGRPVWTKGFEGVDIRQWVGGEGYPEPADEGLFNDLFDDSSCGLRREAGRRR